MTPIIPPRRVRDRRQDGASGHAPCTTDCVAMSEEGGEPACWMNNVCDRCGSLIAGASPHRCRDPISEDSATSIAVDEADAPQQAGGETKASDNDNR